MTLYEQKPKLDSNLQQKDQSPCEHLMSDTTGAGIKFGMPQLWFCVECGLVTCKNPNQE